MTWRRLLGAALALLAAIAPYLHIIPGWTVSVATVSAFLALSLLGLNLIFGVVGMLAFGQAAFMSLPGYVGGGLHKFGVPILPGMAIGLVATIVIARLVAAIFVRLPGMYLAVGTLGFAFVVEGLARAFPDLTGGASGLVFTLGRSVGPNAWYAVALASLAIGLLAYAGLVRGPTLRGLATIRHDELAAAVLGIDVGRWKAWAFTVGSGFAAVAGVLLTSYVGVLVPENAGVNPSLEQVGAVLLGGLGSFWGPVIGTVFVQWLFVVSGYAAKYELLIYGLAFLGAVLYAPRGIVGLIEKAVSGATKASPRASFGTIANPSVNPPISCPARERSGPAERAGCLSVQNVCKSFGGVQALQDVSFEVRHGEIFTMVGPNGAGKSTLFNLICGIEPPSSGTIRVEGRDLRDVPIHARAPMMGRSFQVARLVPQLTVLANVVTRLDQISRGLPEEARRAAALAQLEAFDLRHLADRLVGELSVGQHKLVDLARAAAGQPVLVLLDEPAVGLAEEELVHLEELLARLRARGSAVLIVEHNIGFVERVAERGLVLDGGRPIATGPIKEILSDARVRDAYFGALA